MAERPTRRCVISRDPLRSGDFIAALQASLAPEDSLEIIIDRRQRGSAGMPDLQVDRRQLHQVDHVLEARGFAIVPTYADRMGNGTPPSPQPSEMPIEQPFMEQPFIEEDEQPVESVSSSRGRRPDLVIRILGVLSGLTMTVLLLLSAGRMTGQNLIGRLFIASSWMSPGDPRGQTGESLTAELLPPISETAAATRIPAESPANHSSAGPDGASPSTEGPSSTNPVFPRGDDRPTPSHRETNSRSQATSPGPRASRAAPDDAVRQPGEAGGASRVATARSDEASVPPKAAPSQGASNGRPRLSAPARMAPGASVPSKQVTGALSAEPATPDAVPTRSEGRPRAERVGEPVSRGWGNSYAVRLLNSAGTPMEVFSVVLVAYMADHSVEEIAMGALPEPGMYRATVPTGHSTPVDLRVRVRTTGDKFVEIPVTP